MKKKNILFLVGLFACGTSFAQNTVWPSIGSPDNVGLGTTTPNAKLDIRGAVITGSGYGNLDFHAVDISFLSNSAQMLIGWNRSAGDGESDFISNQGPGGTGGFAFFNHKNDNTEALLMYVKGDGNVGIGTADPQAKLGVNGLVRAKEVKVEAINWPDYVFKPTYKLPSLTNVSIYIKQNGHLPDVPPASDLEANGANLGEMVKLQMKKIEELTLYLIEKDKQLKLQQKQINSLLSKSKLKNK